MGIIRKIENKTRQCLLCSDNYLQRFDAVPLREKLQVLLLEQEELHLHEVVRVLQVVFQVVQG